MSCIMIGVLMILASIARSCTGCPFCARQQLQQLQQRSQPQPQQQQLYRTIGSPRPFGADRPTRVQEFNRTGVLHPEYQIPATIRPGNVSQFYYLSPREGPPLTLLVSPCSGPISWTVSYVEPPENDQEAEAQTRWPVKTLKPGSPLFTYEGAEDQNFTIPKTRSGLYWFEIKSTDPAEQSPGTVLLYATSSALDHVSGIYANGKEHRHRTLRFQQRRSKRRLTISWGKSHVDPHLSNYCLAVTSGTQPHPSTLCAAQNVLKAHPHSSARTGFSPKEHHHRGGPEGLHCARQTKLTLHRMRYDTTYNFTLYVVNTRNNVSNRVATDAIRFKKTPELTLHTGRYTTANLRKTDGFVNFRYRPSDNTSSTFHILPCGGGIVKAKLSGQGILREKEVVGYASLRVPPLPTNNKTYTLRISTTPQELVRVSTIKVLATQESSTIYPQIPFKNPPREYRSLRTCHEVTIGVEPAGAAKYCILVKELRSSSSLASVTTVPDQCGLHRRRRSEYTFEVCEEKRNPPNDRALPFTLRRLQPGKAYLLQITAQMNGQSLSYPLLGVRTRRSCVT
ncbi:neuron derived neurotrophic factor nord isoform X2 [Temnothorax americanus]|uniref:neuron derived neurotrophic factor nord isoform X2 n=1 Tax=Temnothorax americanus TaxID=1964332 RepID=UPI00406802F1